MDDKYIKDTSKLVDIQVMPVTTPLIQSKVIRVTDISLKDYNKLAEAGYIIVLVESIKEKSVRTKWVREKMPRVYNK